MNIIFAIAGKYEAYYKKLAEFIGQKENVGLLAKVSNSQVTDKNKLKNLIKNQYNSIKSMY